MIIAAPFAVIPGQREKSAPQGYFPETDSSLRGALVKQLMNQLHSKKGQEKTLPASLWMRYKAVRQKTPSSP